MWQASQTSRGQCSISCEVHHKRMISALPGICYERVVIAVTSQRNIVPVPNLLTWADPAYRVWLLDSQSLTNKTGTVEKMIFVCPPCDKHHLVQDNCLTILALDTRSPLKAKGLECIYNGLFQTQFSPGDDTYTCKFLFEINVARAQMACHCCQAARKDGRGNGV